MDFNQIINKIGKKNLIIIAIAALSVIFFCFAAFITVEAMGQSDSVSFFGEIFFEDGFTLISLVGLVTIVAAIAIIATAVRNMKKENLLCTYAGAGAAILSLICTFIKCGEIEDQAKAAAGMFGGAMGFSYSAGWGLWVAVIGLVACAVVAHFMPEDNQ